MNRRVVGLIQSRMGSTRLPGKVMMPLAGRPMVWHIFDRLTKTPGVDQVVLATTMDPRNDVLEALGGELGIPVFRAKG